MNSMRHMDPEHHVGTDRPLRYALPGNFLVVTSCGEWFVQMKHGLSKVRQLESVILYSGVER